MPEVVKNLGVFRLAAIAAVALAAAGLLFWFAIQSAKPPMGLLFSGLEARDSAAIVEKLEAQGVAYELRADGTTILVPQEEALRLRMTFAQEGLPAGGGVGYEIFDNQDTLGVSSFQQSVNKLRALEGELSRTIRALDVIENARVHLALPEKRLFRENAQAPSASIVVRPRGNRRLSNEQVAAIQHLVASAVEGMTPERVSVVDDKGQLLANGEGADTPGAMQSRQQERQAAFEERVRAQVEDIVASIAGPGKARVQVSADMDFTRTTRESVTYDPDGQVLRSTQTRSNSQDSQNTESQENVSVGGNLPDGESAGGGTDQSRETEQGSETTENFEISNTKEVQVVEGGELKRLSVAVAVDGNWVTPEGGGAAAYQARSEEDMQKIATLVRSAIGFSETRGDTLEVVNVQFAQAAAESLPPEESGFMGLTGPMILRLVEILILALVTLMAILLIFRPLIKRLLEQSAPGLAPAGAIAGPGGTVIAGALPAPGQAATADQAMIAGPKSETESMIDIAKIEGQVRESSVKKVGEIVNAHPEEAMSIMRAWLHESR